jgi:phasin family protein
MFRSIDHPDRWTSLRRIPSAKVLAPHHWARILISINFDRPFALAHSHHHEGRFMNSLQVAGFPFAYTDLTKAWVNFGLPLHNIGALFEAQRRNAAALTSANQIVFDGLKTLAQHQADFVKATMGDYRKLTSDALAGGSTEERATNQADTARHVYLSSVGHVRELSAIAVKANVTAVAILNARVTEAFDELKAVFTAPVALTDKGNVASPDDTGEHIAIGEQAAALVEEVKPEPVVKRPTRKKAAPAGKAARRRTSRK